MADSKGSEIDDQQERVFYLWDDETGDGKKVAAEYPHDAARQIARSQIDPGNATSPSEGREQGLTRIELREADTRNIFVYDGFTWIEHSAARCPQCGSANVYRRIKKTPQYRCVECEHEFREPVFDDQETDEETVEVGIESRGKRQIRFSESD